jgi:hypothetical protein
VARHDGLGGLDQRRQARHRGAVVVQRSRRRYERDLHVREIVAADEHAGEAGEEGGPVGRVAVGRMELDLGVADLDRARHRQLLVGAERERRRARHVVLGVGVAQLALGRAGLAAQPLGGLPAHPQGEAREGEPAEQVVVVGVGGEQAVGLEAGLGEQRRQDFELVREVRRVHQQALAAAADRGGGGLPEAARDHHHVVVDGYRSQATFSSLAASRSVLTSSVGFFWPDSSFCPRRLTQITGTRCLRQGSTSVS